MKIKDLSLLMLKAINVGEAIAIADRGVINPSTSKVCARHASRLSKVDHRSTEHLIYPFTTPRKSSQKNFDRTKLDGFATGIRHTYLPVADGKL